MLRSTAGRLFVLVMLVAAVAMAAPATAGAVSANYTGYGRYNPNACQPGRMCAAVYRTDGMVWERRSNGSWTQRELETDSVLYVYGWTYPYINTTQWHWAWAYRDRTWYAIPSLNIERY